MPGNGFYHLYSFLWNNVPYALSSQSPQPGLYKSKLNAQCIQLDDDSFQVSIQPNLTLANTLTSTPLLFRQQWDYLDLNPTTGNGYFRLESGLTLGPGVLSTWLQDYLTTFIQAALPDPPTGTQYSIQFFVPVNQMKGDMNNDENDSLIRGICVLYPIALPGQPNVTSGDVYHIVIKDPTEPEDQQNSGATRTPLTGSRLPDELERRGDPKMERRLRRFPMAEGKRKF